MSYLLDTHVCVDVLEGHPDVCARLQMISPADCAISAITAFELAAGVRRCNQSERERKKLGGAERGQALGAWGSVRRPNPRDEPKGGRAGPTTAGPAEDVASRRRQGQGRTKG
ncbi:MAG: type II toxin-antitoxin system VapC family toxin [Opitutaceae bacterium]|nr:type II toxin-antitoxin system VapC family toxin [Opitutaceae bacterium]